jgi:hypothetical protein
MINQVRKRNKEAFINAITVDVPLFFALINEDAVKRIPEIIKHDTYTFTTVKIGIINGGK